MRPSLNFLALLVVAVCSTNAAEGDAPKPTETPKAVESAKAAPAENPLKGEITDTQNAFCDAFNKGDAKLVASLFASDADWIDDQGTVIRGRAAIQRALEDSIGGHKDRTLKLRLDSIRMLSTDVVVGNALSTFSGTDKSSESAAYIAVYLKQDGKWRIALLTETNEVEDDE